MQYLFKKIDTLIVNQLSIIEHNSKIDGSVLAEWLCIVQNEGIQIKQNLVESVFKQTELDKLKHFLVQHHLRLIYLSDIMLGLIENKEFVRNNIQYSTTNNVLKAILLVIDDILGFIWKNYSQYLDLNQKVPQKQRFVVIKEFKEIIKNIRNVSAYEKDELINITLYPIDKIIESEKSKLTFHLQYYLKDILIEIQNYIKNYKENGASHYFLKQLIYMNFNTIKFADFFISNVNTEVLKEDTLSGEIEKLYYFLKMLNQSPVKPDCIFNPKQQGIKEFLIEWILEEISFLEKKLQLSGIVGKENQIKEHNFKVVTELSVSQAACLIRLLVKSGVIKNKNQKELIEFYAAFTQSKKRDNISYDSFRSKYYNIEESARHDVKDLVLKLLKEIHDL